MTEKEKMMNNILYDANSDDELLADHERCLELCYEYNNLYPKDTIRQEAIIKMLLGRVGREFCIYAPFWCDYGYNIEIGNNFFANHNCIILDGAKVLFGDNVWVGPHCGFYTAGHPIDYKRRNEGLEYAFPISIGNNVWIGGGVQVMPGVKIGSNVVIGSGSVVTKSIPDNVVAVGNPCKILRAITKDDEYTHFSFCVKDYLHIPSR